MAAGECRKQYHQHPVRSYTTTTTAGVSGWRDADSTSDWRGGVSSSIHHIVGNRVIPDRRGIDRSAGRYRSANVPVNVVRCGRASIC